MSDSPDAKERFGRNLPAGTVLFREGESGDTMYVLQSGQIAISKSVKTGEQVLAVLRAGEFFGEMAILNGKPRSATAEVVQDAEVLEIDAKRFEGMLKNNTEIAVRLIKKLAGRLDAVNDLLAVMSHRDPTERVILGLLRHAGTEAEPKRVPRGALTEELGLEGHEVDETLRRLTRLSLVEANDGTIEVKNYPRLQAFFEFVEQQQQRS